MLQVKGEMFIAVSNILLFSIIQIVNYNALQSRHIVPLFQLHHDTKYLNVYCIIIIARHDTKCIL